MGRQFQSPRACGGPEYHSAHRYSNLVFDESFEQVLTTNLPKGSEQSLASRLDERRTRGRLNVSAQRVLLFLSLPHTHTHAHRRWSCAASSASGCSWVEESSALNGRVSMRLEKGAILSNRGLYHAGFALEAGRVYEGSLFARRRRRDASSSSSCSVLVALEDWGELRAEDVTTRPAVPGRAAKKKNQRFFKNGGDVLKLGARC